MVPGDIFYSRLSRGNRIFRNSFSAGPPRSIKAARRTVRPGDGKPACPVDHREAQGLQGELEGELPPQQGVHRPLPVGVPQPLEFHGLGPVLEEAAPQRLLLPGREGLQRVQHTGVLLPGQICVAASRGAADRKAIPQGGGLSGLQGGAGPGAGAPGAQGGPGGGPGRSVHLHPQAQAGELVKGPAGHRAQADDCGAVRTHGGPQLAGLPPGGGAVHRHGPEPRQPRQRPAAHLRQIPPREHRVRVEQQQRRAVRPLEHHRLTVKELSHIPHQAQQRPRACRAPRPQSGEPVLPGGAVGIQHGLSSPAHASLSAPASSSGWRIIR